MPTIKRVAVNNNPKQTRVLVSAYACNPSKGSEEGVGWNWLKIIAEFADPHVMVASFHRSDIEYYLASHPAMLKNVTFVYVPHRWWHYQPTPGWKGVENFILKPIMNIAYMLWLHGAYKLAVKLHRKQSFDLAHQLTYVGFRFPGQLWKLDIPFVWGPIGGMENTPWCFFPVLGVKGALYYAGRNIINAMQRVLLHSPRKAFERAGMGVIAATSGIQAQIKRWYGVDSQVICEIGPPEVSAAEVELRQSGEPLRLVWSGEHLPGKALSLLLKALGRLDRGVEWRLDILGQGPLTQSWKQQSRTLGIENYCHWHGLLPRDDALEVVSAGHLFVITSLKDLTSTVLLEALALGVPVICPDHCGFADVVTDECGLKIPVETPRQLETDLSDAIILLEKDEGKRRKLAKGALQRVQDFSWEEKARRVDLIYHRKIKG